MSMAWLASLPNPRAYSLHYLKLRTIRALCILPQPRLPRCSGPRDTQTGTRHGQPSSRLCLPERMRWSCRPCARPPGALLCLDHTCPCLWMAISLQKGGFNVLSSFFLSLSVQRRRRHRYRECLRLVHISSQASCRQP